MEEDNKSKCTSAKCQNGCEEGKCTRHMPEDCPHCQARGSVEPQVGCCGARKNKCTNCNKTVK